jgi:hypothetical protein
MRFMQSYVPPSRNRNTQDEGKQECSDVFRPGASLRGGLGGFSGKATSVWGVLPLGDSFHMAKS